MSLSLLQTRSGRQLSKTAEQQSNGKFQATKTPRNSRKARGQNGWHDIVKQDECAVNTEERFVTADSTNYEAANFGSLKEIMEVQERPTVGNAGENVPFESGKDVAENKRSRRARVRHTSMLERLAPTPGYVDKTSMDFESLAQRRTPRMASLNAAAKVNVFFEPSSPLAGRSLFEIQQHSTTTKKPPVRNSTERRYSDRGSCNGADRSYDMRDLPDSEVFFQSEVTSTWDTSRSKGVIVSPKEFGDEPKHSPNTHFEFVTNGQRTGKDNLKRKPEADSTSEDEKKAKRVHLDGGSELVSTETSDTVDLDESGEVECDTTTDSPPKTMVDVCIQVDLPLPPVKNVRVLSVPIKGQLVTSAGAVPFTKSHLVTPVTPSKPPPELKMSKTATTKRTASMNHQAMENVFAANDGPLAKYKSVGGLIEERSKAKKAKELTNKMPASSSIALKIPKINFAATSTSTMSAGRGRPAGNPLKNIHLKNLNIHLEKLAAQRARAEPRVPKVCTGKDGRVALGEGLGIVDSWFYFAVFPRSELAHKPNGAFSVKTNGDLLSCVSPAILGTLRSNDATATRTSKENSRFNKQNNNFARASLVLVHFFAVFAQLRREFA